MKLFFLCFMVVSHTLAAPGSNKRDIDIYTYHHIPAVRQETTTHYCPEEDIPAKFIPAPPQIQSFPLPSLPNLPIVKYESPIPIPIHVAPIHHEHVPHTQHHPGFNPPRQEYVEPIAPAVPHDSYGSPLPHDTYGLPAFPGFRQESTTLPPPEIITETTTLPPPPPTEPITFTTVPSTESTTPVETTTLPPSTEPPTETTTHKSKWDKIIEFKHHLKNKIKLPEIHFVKPTLVVYRKKIEFPFLKNWFSQHHQ